MKMQNFFNLVKKNKKMIIIGYLLSFNIFILDIISKFSVAYYLRSMPIKFIEIIPNFLNFAEVWNHGVSFGLLTAGSLLGLWGLRLMTVTILCFLLYCHATAQTKIESVSFAFIMGGALGNIFDRFYHGAVYDFIDVILFGWHFWTFNIADIAITIGAFLMVLYYILYETSFFPKGISK